MEKIAFDSTNHVVPYGGSYTMHQPKKILALYSCRADEGLLRPVIRALERMGNTVTMVTLHELTMLQDRIHDLAIIPCDRTEMVYAALFCFYNNIPIAHMDAGETESGSTHDNTGRWVITRVANLIFTNTEEAADKIIKSGEEPWRVNPVGYTFMDDVTELNIEYVRKKYDLPKDYDIVVYNPDTYSLARTIKDVDEIYSLLDKLTIILRPNPDKYSDVVNKIIDNELRPEVKILTKFETRDEFICALRHCQRFIGNSSTMMYEAPYFEVECIHIGERNRGRTARKVKRSELGASDRIAKRIDEVLGSVEREKLLRKRVML